MKELTYFKLIGCPYCKAADSWLDELCKENPSYRSIPIQVVDEARESKIAEQYDYHFVPTFFQGDKKLHEGVATKEKIRAVLDACLLQ